MSKRSQVVLTVLTIILVTFPYIIAMGSAGETYSFNGFLLNPLDGNSYLAKMRLGYSGDWQFTLLFSAAETQGSFLFLFYILLGHIARWLGISLLITFHLVRVAGAILLCMVLARFIKVHLGNTDSRTQTITFALCCLGSGLGWVAAFFGGFTSDFWVAEAYPFLSMYSNPHFPLGLALVLDYFTTLKNPVYSGRKLGLLLKGFLLAAIMPFGVVLTAVVTAGVQVWDLIKQVKPIRWWSLIFMVPGGLFLLYQYAVIHSDPLLMQWNSQNLTPTPPLWDLLIAFSPALIAAVAGLWFLHRRNDLYEFRLLIVWMIFGLLLAYFPFQLQRRFLLGYFIPIACLAGMMLGTWTNTSNRLPRAGLIVFFAVSFFTNLIILAGGLAAIRLRDPNLYFPKGMQEAFDWMASEVDGRPLILASPETGLIIPGATGWRVVYGHPYETPDAENNKSLVESAYTGEMSRQELGQFLDLNGIDYIFMGPFEQESMVDNELFSDYPVVYRNDSVLIYWVEDES